MEHQPIVIDDFKGLFDQDNLDKVPPDHFTDCLNIDYTGLS